MNKNYNIDRLVLGIESIISKNHYSFSIEDEAILKECKTLLVELKSVNKDIKVSQELVIKATELIVKFLSLGEHLDGLI